jgi:phage/conjugal plasmid C-4 type zinc finger TraR family protein
MSDDADDAQAFEARDRDQALARHASRRASGRQGGGGQTPRPAGRSLCLLCGEPIPRRRLRVLPQAKTCIQCQRALERLGPGAG